MKVILDIPENKYQFFLELVRNLTFVKEEDSDTIPQWQQEEVSKRLQLIEKGEMKTRSWHEAKKDIFKK